MAEVTAAQPIAQRQRCDIFLCHNRNDRIFVREVAEGLELEFGIPHFLDEYAIPVGEQFLPWIEGALKESKGCAIFLGPNGWGPTHFWEAERALERYRADAQFRLIPVVIGEARPEDVARLGSGSVFGNINWVRFEKSQVDIETLSRLRSALTGTTADTTRGPARLTPYLLRRDAQRWHETSDKSLLYRGKELRDAQRLVADTPALTGGPDVAAFLAACASESTKRAWTFTLISVAVSIALVGLLIFALYQSRVSRSRELSALALSSDYRDRGLLLAEAAYKVKPTIEAKASFFRLLTALRQAAIFLHGSAPGIRAVDISPAGDLVAAGGDGGKILIWNLKHPSKPISELPSPPSEKNLRNQIHAIAFTGNGEKILAGYERGGVRIWKIHTRKWQAVAGWPKPNIGTARVSTNWQGADPDPPERRGERPVTALRIDPSAKFAVIGDYGGRILGVDLTTSSVQWQYQFDLNGIESIAWIADENAIVAADGGGKMQAVDSNSRVPISFATRPHGSRLVIIEGRPKTASAGPSDAKLVTVDSTGRVVYWRRTANVFEQSELLNLPILPVAAAIRWPQNFLLIATRSGDIRVFDVATGAEIPDMVLSGHRLAAMAIHCSNTAPHCASGGVGGEVILWNANPSHPLLANRIWSKDFIKALHHNSKGAVEMVTQPDNQIAWGPPSNNKPRSAVITSGLSAIAFSKGDAAALAPDDGRVVWLEKPSSKKMLPFGNDHPEPGSFYLVAASSSGRFVAAVDSANRLFLWNKEQPQKPVFMHPREAETHISNLLFSPDELYLIAGYLDGRLSKWYLQDPQDKPASFQISQGPIFALAFSNDGRRLFSGSGAGDRKIRILHFPSLHIERELPERHTQSISDLKVSPDGKTLASAGEEGDVILWDMGTWREIAVFPHGEDVILQDMMFDGDNRIITTDSHQIWTWRVGDADLIEQACAIANRTIPSSEWQQAVGGRQPASSCTIK